MGSESWNRAGSPYSDPAITSTIRQSLTEAPFVLQRRQQAILTGPVSGHPREVRHIRRLRPRISPDTGPDRRQQLGDFLIEPQRQVLGRHSRAAPMQLVAVRLQLRLHLSRHPRGEEVFVSHVADAFTV